MRQQAKNIFLFLVEKTFYYLKKFLFFEKNFFIFVKKFLSQLIFSGTFNFFSRKINFTLNFFFKKKLNVPEKNLNVPEKIFILIKKFLSW